MRLLAGQVISEGTDPSLKITMAGLAHRHQIRPGVLVPERGEELSRRTSELHNAQPAIGGADHHDL